MNGPEFQAIEREMAPKLAAFSDEITQNEKLFQRIEAVYDSPDKAKLTPEQQRLAWVRYTDFVRAGAKLDAAAKKRAGRDQPAAGLALHHVQPERAGRRGELRRRPRDARRTWPACPTRCARAPRPRPRRARQKGKWVITNTRSSMEPFLTYSSRRDLREKVWRNYVNRGDNGDAHDNNAIISEILQAARRAGQAAGLRDARALAAGEHHGQDARAGHGADGGGVDAGGGAGAARRSPTCRRSPTRRARSSRSSPWDYRYYAEKVRKAKYDLDQNEVKPYLQLEKLREGMFWVAGELFGFAFAPVSERAGVPPGRARVGGEGQGQRQARRALVLRSVRAAGQALGAWMNAYRNQERFKGEVTTIVSNNSNFVKGQPGEPVLISWDDAETLFHEFGHALHGLASQRDATRRCRAPRWRATTWSSRRSCSSTGWPRPRC